MLTAPDVTQNTAHFHLIIILVLFAASVRTTTTLIVVLKCITLGKVREMVHSMPTGGLWVVDVRSVMVLRVRCASTSIAASLMGYSSIKRIVNLLILVYW